MLHNLAYYPVKWCTGISEEVSNWSVFEFQKYQGSDQFNSYGISLYFSKWMFSFMLVKRLSAVGGGISTFADL